jgi:hypothetical protein
MTSTDEGLKQLLLEGEFVRPFHDLIHHSDLGCFCCTFILAVVDVRTLPESKTAFVRVSGSLLSGAEDKTKEFLSILALNDMKVVEKSLWITSFRFQICYQSTTVDIPIISYNYWQAYAIEGNVVLLC